MTNDSRISKVREEKAPYGSSTSGSPTDLNYWIQPPLNQQTLEPASHLIDGIYIQTESHFYLALKANLDQEFAAWEAASDEALILFEKELD
jgi:hypothetical protein